MTTGSGTKNLLYCTFSLHFKPVFISIPAPQESNSNPNSYVIKEIHFNSSSGTPRLIIRFEIQANTIVKLLISEVPPQGVSVLIYIEVNAGRHNAELDAVQFIIGLYCFGFETYALNEAGIIYEQD